MIRSQYRIVSTLPPVCSAIIPIGSDPQGNFPSRLSVPKSTAPISVGSQSAIVGGMAPPAGASVERPISVLPEWPLPTAFDQRHRPRADRRPRMMGYQSLWSRKEHVASLSFCSSFRVAHACVEPAAERWSFTACGCACQIWSGLLGLTDHAPVRAAAGRALSSA